VADAQSADHGLRAVGDEQLTVIALEDLERVPRENPVEGAHLRPGLHEPPPVATGRADRAEGVVQHADRHPSPRALGEGVGEAATGAIVPDDVVLEMTQRRAWAMRPSMTSSARGLSG